MLLRIFFNLSLLFFSFALLAQQSYIDYRSPFHPTVSKSGMVVSQNIDSSNIGIEILDMGGNAVDAAVAVGFSLAITLPRARGSVIANEKPTATAASTALPPISRISIPMFDESMF